MNLQTITIKEYLTEKSIQRKWQGAHHRLCFWQLRCRQQERRSSPIFQ